MSNSLKQTLSLFDATMIVAGSMIGSGIFIVSADMSRQLGSAGYLLLAWVASAVITLIAALSYGELAGMMPKAGGQYVYLKEAYGPRTGFLYGWTSFMVNQTGFLAAVGVAFAKFTAVFVPSLGLDNTLADLGLFKISAGQVLAISIVCFITFINTRGVQAGKLVQGIFTSTKLLALAVLVIVGLVIAANGHFIHENFQNMWNATATTVSDKGVVTTIPLTGMALMAALGVAMVGSLFSSDAWNNVTFISAEIKNPGRNIPLSLLFGTLMVGVLYVLANITYLAILPLHGSPTGATVMEQGIQFAKNDRVATSAVSLMLGNSATYVMAALIMISTFGCINGIALSSARLYYAMAKDGLFFKQALDLNSKNVPAKSLVFQCIWASVLCLSGTYGELLDYITIASLLFYALTIGGIFILRKRQPDLERPYKVFGYPFLPALYVIIALAICVDLLVEIPKTTWPGIIIVLLGLPVYYLVKKKGNSMKAISAQEFFTLSSQHPVIDVRTPAEFEHGHIPGAVNIPLFSNEERAIIGTLYKQEGKKPAMLKGMELVSPKFSSYIREAETISNTGTLLVHCWRGGMRSGGMAWLFEWYGFKVFTLQSGYKAFRRMALDTIAQPHQLKILAGRTGSGKTLILKEIEKLGRTIIDLEELAHHKGSAFGTLGEAPQPTQEMFENELAVSLMKITSGEPVWLEDESQNIGKRILPNSFYTQMRVAQVYYVDLPLEKRVDYLVEAYGKYSAQELIESIEKIRKRVGFQNAKAAIEAINSGDLKRACEISLVYYDKSYDHGVAKRNADTIHKTMFEELKPKEIAEAII